MRRVLYLYAVAVLAALFVAGCQLCDEFEQFLLEQCQAERPGVKAVNVQDHYHKGNGVYRFRFDAPGSSVNQCDLKFLEFKTFIEEDSIEVCRYAERNVGNAFFIVHNIIPFANDSSRYWLKQGRETFMSVYNNDSVCDGGNAPNEEYFYVRFNKCNDYAVLGDTMGLRLIP